MDDLGLLFHSEIGAPSARPGASSHPAPGDAAADASSRTTPAPNPFDTDSQDAPALAASTGVYISSSQQSGSIVQPAAALPPGDNQDRQASAAAAGTGPVEQPNQSWATFDPFGAPPPAQPVASNKPPSAPSMRKQGSSGPVLGAATIVQASVTGTRQSTGTSSAERSGAAPVTAATTTAVPGAKGVTPGRLSTDAGGGRGSPDPSARPWEQSNPAWGGQGRSGDSRGTTVVVGEGAPDAWEGPRGRAGTGGSRTSRDSTASSALEFGGRSYASRTSRNADDGEEGNPSYAPPAEPSDHIEGTVFIRASAALVLKAWRPSWAQLKVGHGQITVWESKEAKLTGEPPIQIIELGPGMGLSSMKVATPGSAVAGSTGFVSLAAGMYSAATALVKAESGLPPRIYYRHVADIGVDARKLDAQAQAQAANAAAAANGNSSVRVWKFGLDSQSGFTRWSAAIRASIDLLAKDEQSRASRAAVMDSAISASDFLRSAISSPPAAGAGSHGLPSGRPSRGGAGDRGTGAPGQDHGKEKESMFVFGKSGGRSGEDSGAYTAPLHLSVHLLDGTEIHLNGKSLQPTQHTPPDFEPSVHNICLALKRQIGVHEDADFSLFLATVPPDVPSGGSTVAGGCAGWGGHAFVCLPDVMSAREAHALVNAQMGQGRGGAGAGPAMGIGSGLAMSPPPLGGRPLPTAALVYRRRGYMPSTVRAHGLIPTLAEYYCYTEESLAAAQAGSLGACVAPGHKAAPSFDLLGLIDVSTPTPPPDTAASPSQPIKLGDMLQALFTGLQDAYVCPGGLPPFDAEAFHDFSADPNAEQTAGAGTGALRLSFIECSYLFITGYTYIPLLEQALTLAALHLIAAQGPRLEEDGGQNIEWYRRQIASLLPASAVLQHRASTGLGAEGLAGILRDRHHTLSVAPYNIIPGQARRLYVQRCAACPEYGGTAFVGELSRYMDNGTSTSKTAAPTPAWLESLTQDSAPPRDSREERDSSMGGGVYRSSRRAAEGPEPFPVQFTLCHLGLLVRPLPPRHPAASSYSYTPVLNTHKEEAPGREPFYLHPITHIDIWGTKKQRPVFTYRVRERGGGICVELQSPQYREAASSLHATVFMLLAAKEGQARQQPRSAGGHSPGASGAGMDSAAMAAAAKAATRRAKAEALQHDPLPDGWTEIIDPTTGAMAYWNQQTKRTVFSRPIRA